MPPWMELKFYDRTLYIMYDICKSVLLPFPENVWHKYKENQEIFTSEWVTKCGKVSLNGKPRD